MNRKKLMQCLICILLAVLSATVVCEKTESSSLHQNTISYLDEKKDTAMALTASSAIASVAIAAVPGNGTWKDIIPVCFPDCNAVIAGVCPFRLQIASQSCSTTWHICTGDDSGNSCQCGNIKIN